MEINQGGWGVPWDGRFKFKWRHQGRPCWKMKIQETEKVPFGGKCMISVGNMFHWIASA